MKILALDTSTEACGVALSVDGHICDRFGLGVQHSSLILAMVDEVMAEAALALADLDVLAFGRGPGSFTGLRIAAGVAQGLANATDATDPRSSRGRELFRQRE